MMMLTLTRPEHDSKAKSVRHSSVGSVQGVGRKSHNDAGVQAKTQERAVRLKPVCFRATSADHSKQTWEVPLLQTPHHDFTKQPGREMRVVWMRARSCETNGK